MTDLNIRQATIHDLALIVPLFDAYRSFYGQPSDEAGARSYLTARLGQLESVILLAQHEGAANAAGFVQLYPSFSSISMKRLWILNDLFVHTLYRKGGVASRLLEAAKRHAVATGAKGLTLSTALDNVGAQRLYERAGYERDEAFCYYDLTL
ncbi:GNAT family N-acetyltransferase [Cohnella sp. 56]|uniref:GNAT family N-acetyltransferase n=1 Tax=Cohnella sp. 56 TaxID=3113722 RepID=UPI0030E9DE0A